MSLRVVLVAAAIAAVSVSSAAASARYLRVRPTVATRGSVVTVSGGGCRTGDTVYLISPAFVGHAFVQHSVATKARARGTFSRRVRTRTGVSGGRYAITARCGGGNLGVEAFLRLR